MSAVPATTGGMIAGMTGNRWVMSVRHRPMHTVTHIGTAINGIEVAIAITAVMTTAVITLAAENSATDGREGVVRHSLFDSVGSVGGRVGTVLYTRLHLGRRLRCRHLRQTCRSGRPRPQGKNCGRYSPSHWDVSAQVPVGDRFFSSNTPSGVASGSRVLI